MHWTAGIRPVFDLFLPNRRYPWQGAHLRWGTLALGQRQGVPVSRTPAVNRHYHQVYLLNRGVVLTKEKIVNLLQEKHSYLAAEFGVSKIGLFGSYAKDQPVDTSDIDLIVEFERPIGFRFMELVDYLENLLGHRVDVLTPAGVQNIRIERIARSISQSIVYV